MFSALLGPVFASIMRAVSASSPDVELQHYRATFVPLLYGVAIAVGLALVLRETGPAARRTPSHAHHGEPTQ
jgi:hypothetical protein